MHNKARIGAIVMASGASERFGEVNKLLADFRGQPMLAWSLNALSDADCLTRRLVVTRNERIATLAREHGFEALLHDLPDRCDTIRLGVAALRDMDGLMFCVGDQPLLNSDTVRALAERFADDPRRICRASFEGRVGNPVLFPKRLFDALASLKPGQTGSAVIRANPSLVTLVVARDASELVDIDTLADYQRYAEAGDKP